MPDSSVVAANRGSVTQRTILKASLGAVAFMSTLGGARAALPQSVVSQLPSGYEVIASTRVSAGQPMHGFEIVALAREGEDKLRQARRAG